LNDLKIMALHTLQAASRLALPWNFVLETLDMLPCSEIGEKHFGLEQNNFGLITKFIEQVIHSNAENWDDNQPFLTSLDLLGKWLGDIAEKSSRGGGGKNSAPPLGKTQPP
jgi:hypothetical protein